MAGWQTKIELLKLDPRLQRNVDEEIKQLVILGARKWLDAALAIVPTWSRASRATFEALAQAVGYKVTYGPVRSFVDRQGLGLATGFGGIERKAKGFYTFYYRTNLRYLIFNESNKAVVGKAGVFRGLINPTPYNFRDAGQRAFEEFMRRQRVESLANLRIKSERIV